MRVGLVGDAAAGKTSFFGAIVEKHRTLPAFPYLPPQKHRQLIEMGLGEQVSFIVDGFRIPSDQNKFDAIAAGLRESPIRYPLRTSFSDYFPMKITYVRELRKREYDASHVTHEKEIEFFDIPGAHLGVDSDAHGEAGEKTRQRLLESNALIVFIDVREVTKLTNANHRLTDSIRRVIVEASAKKQYSGRYFPVSFVFSKFDEIRESCRAAAVDEIFNKVVIPFTRRTGNITVMACPISVENQGEFSPVNIQYPFLFSAMTIIGLERMSTLDKATSARNEREESIWKRFQSFLEDFQTIGSMERRAQRDEELMRGIYQTLCADERNEGNFLWFAENGSRIHPSQIQGKL